MHVLVTGGAGFIGSHVIEALLDRGDSVWCLDNFNPYYAPTRKRTNLEPFVSSPRFQLYEDDIRDAVAIETILAGTQMDAVIHLAAMAGVRHSLNNPLFYEEVNVRGTLNLLEASVRFRVPHFVLASTSSVYGRTEKIPFVETDPTDHPLAPYPATKKAAELLAYSHHSYYRISISVLRLFNVYGPRGRPDMTPYSFTERIANHERITLYDGGRPRRDWTYVSDVVAGCLAALDRPFGYEIFNIGHSEPVQMREFVSIIEELTGIRAEIDDKPLPESDPLVTYADISKAQRMLGYQPRVSVREGMREFVRWFGSTRTD
jgi:UDP-glucuronate 4-epimerase